MGAYLTVAEVARQLKLAKMTVYRLIHAGQLDAVKVGKSYRIEQKWLDAYLKGARTREQGSSGRTRGAKARRVPEG